MMSQKLQSELHVNYIPVFLHRPPTFGQATIGSRKTRTTVRPFKLWLINVTDIVQHDLLFNNVSLLFAYSRLPVQEDNAEQDSVRALDSWK